MSSPDLIINVDNNLGEGRRNEDIVLGDATLEPRHFGVDAPYVPIEVALQK